MVARARAAISAFRRRAITTLGILHVTELESRFRSDDQVGFGGGAGLAVRSPRRGWSLMPRRNPAPRRPYSPVAAERSPHPADMWHNLTFLAKGTIGNRTLQTRNHGLDQ
jgi:hypothetical protein